MRFLIIIHFTLVFLYSEVSGYSKVRSIGKLHSTGRSFTSLEDLRETLVFPPDNICIAVDKTSNKKLSVADASTIAGCDLRTARNGLVLLASLTGANLDVTKDGEIIYTFPENYRQILLRRSLGQKLKSAYNTIKAPLSFLFRISFGLLLFASLFIIGTTFAFISIQGQSSSDDRDDSRGSRRSSQAQISSLDYFSLGPSPLDYMLYGRPSTPRTDDGDAESEISFLESFFSYIFGDGDPNEGFSAEQLGACAELIRSNGGVVTAEQLAPLLDPPPVLQVLRDAEGASGSVVREDWVLPVLVSLNGAPSVTEDGDIVYLFPDLTITAQTTTTAQRGWRLLSLFTNIGLLFNRRRYGSKYRCL